MATYKGVYFCDSDKAVWLFVPFVSIKSYASDPFSFDVKICSCSHVYPLVDSSINESIDGHSARQPVTSPSRWSTT